MKEIKYRVMSAVASQTGRVYYFVRTEGMDYGMFVASDGEKKFFEGSIENFVPADVMESATKASINQILIWFNAICEEDIHGELQSKLMNIIELKKFDKKGKLMLFNDMTNQIYSCWKMWKCKNEQLNHKVRYLISEICAEGFTLERLKQLKKAVDQIDFENGSPKCEWFLNRIYPNSDVAVIKARENGNEFFIRLILTKDKAA